MRRINGNAAPEKKDGPGVDRGASGAAPVTRRSRRGREWERSAVLIGGGGVSSTLLIHTDGSFTTVPTDDDTDFVIGR